MNDYEIIEKFGSHETTLGDVLHGFQTFDRKKWYVFHIRDANNVLWAVDAYWSGDGWDVEANSISNPYGWDAGGEFVSRDPFETLPSSDTLTLGNLDTRLRHLEKLFAPDITRIQKEV